MIKKIKIIPTLIVIGIALLIGYTFFAANNTEWQKWLMFGLSSIEFLIFLEVAFGIELESRKAINLIIVSIIFADSKVINNQIYGQLVLKIPNDDDSYQKAITYLKIKNIHYEEDINNEF